MQSRPFCLVSSGQPLPQGEEIAVWHADLDDATLPLDALAGTLSPDESARAQRFRFPLDRARFVAARGLLRALLGRLTQTAPERLMFDYNRFGKPLLTEECGGDWVQFNVSHADGLAVYALARGRAVGVDVERVRDLPDRDDLATRVFGPTERASLASLPASERPFAFFQGWTRKEAVLKACGRGLVDDLDSLVTACAPGKLAHILQFPLSLPEAERCFLSELTVVPGFVGALALLEPPASRSHEERPIARS